MKVITDCPLCNKDFMYDPKWDSHLFRQNMPPNTGTLGLKEEDLAEQDDTIVICQDCDELQQKNYLKQ